MTFYNIIFGILFLGACRQVLLLASDTTRLWMAATVAVLVFNDVVNTSHVLEGTPATPATSGTPGKPYTYLMKLLDLVNFSILSCALIALKPSDNPFGVAVSPGLSEALTLSTFWLLLFFYWVLVVLWNELAGLYQARNYPSWLKKTSYCIALPFLVMAIMAGDPPTAAAKWGSIFAFAVPAAYLVVAKPLAEWTGSRKRAEATR